MYIPVGNYCTIYVASKSRWNKEEDKSGQKKGNAARWQASILYIYMRPPQASGLLFEGTVDY